MGQRLVRMELKYCERCGGLLLRRSGEAVVYCGPCDMKLQELPPAGQSKRPDTMGARLSPVQPETDSPSAVRIPPQRATLEANQAVEYRRQA